MIGTSTSAATLPIETQLGAGLKRIALATFLAFGLAVPGASATCLGKIAGRHVVTPNAHAPVEMPEALVAPRMDPRFPDSLVGLWTVNFISGGQVVDVAYDVWHDDGTEILNDYTDPIEGNVCLGTWEQTGLHTYSLKHPSRSFDDTGKLQGTVVISEVVTLSADNNSYTGTYKYDIYYTKGKFLEELTGKEKATRITPN
jgi:hypothetical protein